MPEDNDNGREKETVEKLIPEKILKFEKLEKLEIKEKPEKYEHKEKPEKWEHKEKPEKAEFKEKEVITDKHKDLVDIKTKDHKEGNREVQVDPGLGSEIERRLAALEHSVASLNHFITTGQRPDLSHGALHNEPGSKKST